MAAFPSYARLILASGTESIDPSVERTQMERSIAKQRVINSSPMAQFSATVLFQSKADIASFETWWKTTISRVGWFDLTHPRTGSLIQARFVGGDIGTLQPATAGFTVATRDVVMEYLL